MKTLHTQIVDKFIERLETAEQIDEPKARALRDLLTKVSNPKADDFVKVFCAAAESGVK